MQKRVASSRWQSFGVMCVHAYYVNFQFPHAYMRQFCPTNYKKITKHFQYGYKTKIKLKYITHYAIFQNRRICASCQLYGLIHYAACVFLPIYKWLAACACWCVWSGCLYSLGPCGHWESESVSVFDGFLYL